MSPLATFSKHERRRHVISYDQSSYRSYQRSKLRGGNRKCSNRRPKANHMIGWNNESYVVSKETRAAIQLPLKQRLVGPIMISLQIPLFRQRSFHCSDVSFASRRFLFLLSYNICKLIYLCHHGTLRLAICKSTHHCLSTSVDNNFARFKTERIYQHHTES